MRFFFLFFCVGVHCVLFDSIIPLVIKKKKGVLSIVDEDLELAMRETCREKHQRNVRPYRQVGNVGT